MAGPLRHRSLDVGAIRLHCVEAGDPRARLVVLLHGFPEFWGSWEHSLHALAAAGFFAVAPDMRGYNESAQPRAVGAYTIEHLVADMRGLLAAYGRTRASFVGHDWGGRIAWELAKAQPECVENLIILDCPHPRVLSRALQTWKQKFTNWYMLAFQLPVVPERKISADNFATLRRLFAGYPQAESYVQAAQRTERLRGPIHYYRANYRALFSDRSERVITCPTLILWGEHDAYLGQHLAAPDPHLVPNARVEVIAGASHWLQLDAPEEVSRRIIAELSRSSAPRPCD